MNSGPAVTGATIEAEEALLGAIMIEASRGTLDAVKKAAGLLSPLDFYGCVPQERPENWVPNARFFLAMTKCADPPDQVVVAHKLAELNMLQLKDCAALGLYIAGCPCSLDYMSYARAVKGYSQQRRARYLASKGDLKGLSRLTEPVYKGLQL